MATEWYLLKTPYDQVSGFESEALNDFGTEGISEVLDSDIAYDVELYNYDLSECKTIRAIIENNMQDTKLQSIKRQIVVPIGTLKAGMYIKYKGRFWLIIGLVDDNKVYEKGVLELCNYKITWMNDSGRVIQRWACVESAAQYNNGETPSRFYTIRSDQIFVLTSDDDDVMMLHSGQRFIIDKRCEIYEKQFDSNVKVCTDNPVIVYRITRIDSVIYNYSDSGHGQFMATQTEQYPTDGYYVIDGKGYWLCKEPEESESKPTTPYCKIVYDENVVYSGLDETVFLAEFYDSNGNKVDNITPSWSIDSEFTDKLNVSYNDNAVVISTDQEDIIGKTFKLNLMSDGYTTDTVDVTIKAFI